MMNKLIDFRHFLGVCVFLCLWTAAAGQINLVPNPGFEEYYDCNFDAINTPIDSVIPFWHGRRVYPRYYNTKCIDPPNDPYFNKPPFQHLAYEGDAYLIISSFDPWNSDESGWQFRGYAQCQLVSPLQPGRTYFLEYQVRPSYNGWHIVHSHLGVDFTDSMIFDAKLGWPQYPVITKPTLEIDSIHGDKDAWNVVRHCFHVEESASVMTIGVFAPIDSIQYILLPDHNGRSPFNAYDAFYLIEITDSMALHVERDTICVGDCVTFSTTHSRIPGSFSWSFPGGLPASGTDSVMQVCYTQPGVYGVIVEAEHCGGTYRSEFLQAVVVVDPPASAPADTLQILALEGETVMLSGCDPGQGQAVRWLPDAALSCVDCAQPSVLAGADAVYTAVWGHEGCTDTCRIALQVLPRVALQAGVDRDTICVEECLFLTGGPIQSGLSYTYAWGGSTPQAWDGMTPISLCGMTPGSHVLTVVGGHALEADTLQFAITVLPGPTRQQVPLTYELYSGDVVVIQAGLVGDRLLWSAEPSDALSLNCSDCTSVTVQAQRSGFILLNAWNGPCADSLQYAIRVIIRQAQLYLPTAFSPNGDGINDTFRAYGRYFRSVALDIYDRWGNHLYTGTGQDVAWDGHSGGRVLDPGVYVYVFRYTDDEGHEAILSGEVQLLR